MNLEKPTNKNMTSKKGAILDEGQDRRMALPCMHSFILAIDTEP